MEDRRAHMRTARTVSVKSAARILDVLELLSSLKEGIGLNELARRLDIPKSSASALIATLEGRGYVRSGADGVALVDAFREGGWIGGESAVLLRHARPAMQRLSRRTGESCFLGTPTRSFDVQYVEKVVSESALRYDADLSLIRPAYCTSIGLVLLAGLDAAQLDRYFEDRELARLTPKTVTDEAAIRKAIAKTRRNGFATISDSHVLGTSGVSAPVLRQGRIVAGLALIAPSERFAQQAALNIEATVAAATELSQSLDR
jgi:DNA-binding IclR family transcriptional regulator